MGHLKTPNFKRTLVIITVNPIYLLLALILLVSCEPASNKTDNSGNLNETDLGLENTSNLSVQEERNKEWNIETPEIIICGVAIEWDNSKSDFTENSGFSELKVKFQANKSELITEILNEEITKAWSCNDSRQLTKGELSFAFIKKITSLPLGEIFNMQWDVFEINCPYPIGLFSYVSKNRSTVVDKLTDYFK